MAVVVVARRSDTGGDRMLRRVVRGSSEDDLGPLAWLVGGVHTSGLLPNALGLLTTPQFVTLPLSPRGQLSSV